MTWILDLTAKPALGRLRGINRKHRFRSKHYAPIGDWPDNATFDVLDAAAVAKADHLGSTDAVFVVSDKLKAVLEQIAPELKSFPAKAGKQRVWVVVQPKDDDVMYEADGPTEYAKSGYQLAHATNVRVQETPKSAWSRVRNTTLIALADSVIAAAAEAGVTWEPASAIAEYRPHTPHPYVMVRSNASSTETLETIEPWPTTPEHVAHPLRDFVRDENFEKDDPDIGWSSLVHQKEIARSAIARYCSGMPLPPLRAVLDPDVSKSKLKKRWKESTMGGGLSCQGLFVVSTKIKELLGATCRYTPLELVDTKLEQKHVGYWLVEPPTVTWIDWAGSDVMFQWSGMYDGMAGLHPTPESYEGTQPIVRVAGTNLILMHRDVVAKLDASFYLKPLHEMSFGLNLDDYWRVI